MSTTFTEDTYEKALITLFQDTLGYRYECGYDIERDVRKPYYTEVLETSLRKINKDLDPSAINELIKKITSIEAGNLVQNNEQFIEFLQNGVSVETVSGSKFQVSSSDTVKEYRTVLAKLIDFENINNNDFRIVNQWTVEEFSKKRCDIVVMINGLPLVVIELKSPSNDTVGEDDAYNQIKAYQKEVPSLFTYNCFNVISDMITSRAGTITANKERYMEWKTKDGNMESDKIADYDTFFEGIFKKEHLLDLIQNYICFDKREGKTGKILAGYHQYFAVNKAIVRAHKAVESDGKIGVFWHTQGSGKSLSMVFFAHLLIKEFAESTIVVVTDRKDLDQQLYTQFSACRDFLRQTPDNAGSRGELKQLLKDRKAGGIIFTTIQKFEEGEDCLSDRRNIIVMTDEAHRSQYGEEHWDVKQEKMKKGFALKMREALPNASFIGFTGTPVSDRDRDTQEVFGDYIDVYDMTQAVEDGATRPVYYESRVVKLELNTDVMLQLDKEFDNLVSLGATDEQVERTKKDMSRLEDVLSADSTIDSLVKDIVKHYEENRADHLTGKAMIVALTRGVGIKIYKKILELRPDWKEKVAVVMTASNKDPEEWRDIIGNEQYKKELAKKFKDNNDPLKIAIVRDMWLTGFDVPSLATMYVYKAMSGHNLMQAIARVNRVFPGKEGGLIVDYIGIAQALRTAMHDYTIRDQEKFGDPNIAKTALNKFIEEQEICRDKIHGYKYDDFFGDDDSKKAACLKEALNFMLDKDKEERRKEFIKHSQLLHNAETLCKSLLSVHDKLEASFFDALRVMIIRFTQSTTKITRKEINQRIGELLRQSIKSDGVINLFENRKAEFSLFDEQFMDELKKMKEKNIALQLLKNLLQGKIHTYKRYNLVQSERFSNLLKEAMNRYINGMISNEEVLEEMMKLVSEIKKAEEQGNSLGLTDEEKAFYDALSKPELARKAYTDEQFVALTRELTEALRKNRTIDWNKKESARAQMRVMIKRLLKKYKYPPEGAEEALDTVMAQCDSWADNEENFYVAPDEEENVYATEAPVVEYDFTASKGSMAADKSEIE